MIVHFIRLVDWYPWNWICVDVDSQHIKPTWYISSESNRKLLFSKTALRQMKTQLGPAIYKKNINLIFYQPYKYRKTIAGRSIINYGPMNVQESVVFI